MTKARNIIERAKKELVDFICYEIPLLYKKFGWYEPDEDEDYIINSGDLCHSVTIKVETDNSYLGVNERTFEDVEVAEIVLSKDGEVLIGSTEDEFTINDISLNELANIADVLELTYNKK